MTTVRRWAQLTGLAYLVLFVSGIVGFLLIRRQLYVPGDAMRTAANLVAHEGLARLGIAVDLVTVLAQALAAVGFFLVFRRVDSVGAASITARRCNSCRIDTRSHATAPGVRDRILGVAPAQLYPAVVCAGRPRRLTRSTPGKRPRAGPISSGRERSPFEATTCGHHTPQVPPANPIVTTSPSTMTGTTRRPPLCCSISTSCAGFFFTFTYSNATPRAV